MENLIEILLFLLIAAITGIGSKQPRRTQQRRKSRPVWPPQSPVPGPFDTAPPPVARPPWQTEVWEPEPVLMEDAREGTSVEAKSSEGSPSEGIPSEGIPSEGKSVEGLSQEGRQTEGYGGFQPGTSRLGGSVLAERQEFARHRAEFRASGLTPGLQPSIRSSIQQTTQIPAAHTHVPADAAPRASLQAMLHDREGLARAVLLAEVLGKPKALRPGR